MNAPTTTDTPFVPGDVFVSSHQKGIAAWESRMTVLELNEKGVKFRREHPLYASSPECFLDWTSLLEKSSWVLFTGKPPVEDCPGREDERVLLHEIGDTFSVDIRPPTPNWLSFRSGGRIDKNGRANFSLSVSEVEELVAVLSEWVDSRTGGKA